MTLIAPSGRIAVVTKTISLGEYTRPHGAMFMPGNETRVAVTSETTQNLVLVSLSEGKVEGAIPTQAGGTVSIIDTKSGTIVETLRGFKLPYRIAMSTDGLTAIICDPEGDKLHIADVRARKVIWTRDAIGSPRGVNIAPRRRVVRTASALALIVDG